MSEQSTQARTSFASFQFNAIGKPPALLSRLSEPETNVFPDTLSSSVNNDTTTTPFMTIEENQENDRRIPSLFSRIAFDSENEKLDTTDVGMSTPNNLMYSPESSHTINKVTKVWQSSEELVSGIQLPTPPSSTEIGSSAPFFDSISPLYVTSSPMKFPKSTPFITNSRFCSITDDHDLLNLLQEERSAWNEVYKNKLKGTAVEVIPFTLSEQRTFPNEEESQNHTSRTLVKPSSEHSCSVVLRSIAQVSPSPAVTTSDPPSTTPEKVSYLARDSDNQPSPPITPSPPSPPPSDITCDSAPTTTIRSPAMTREDELKFLLKEKARRSQIKSQLQLKAPTGGKVVLINSPAGLHATDSKLTTVTPLKSLESKTSVKMNTTSIKEDNRSSNSLLLERGSKTDTPQNNLTPLFSHAILSPSKANLPVLTTDPLSVSNQFNESRTWIPPPSFVVVPVKTKLLQTPMRVASNPSPNNNVTASTENQLIKADPSPERPRFIPINWQRLEKQTESLASTSKLKLPAHLPPKPVSATEAHYNTTLTSQKRKRSSSFTEETARLSPVKIEDQENPSVTLGGGSIALPKGRKKKKKKIIAPPTVPKAKTVKMEEVEHYTTPSLPSSSSNDSLVPENQAMDRIMTDDIQQKQHETEVTIAANEHSPYVSGAPVANSVLGSNNLISCLAPSQTSAQPPNSSTTQPLPPVHHYPSHNLSPKSLTERENHPGITFETAHSVPSIPAVRENIRDTQGEGDSITRSSVGNRDLMARPIVRVPPSRPRVLLSPKAKVAGGARLTRADCYRPRSPPRISDRYVPQRSNRRSISPRGRDSYPRRRFERRERSRSNEQRFYRHPRESSRSRERNSYRSRSRSPWSYDSDYRGYSSDNNFRSSYRDHDERSFSPPPRRKSLEWKYDNDRNPNNRVGASPRSYTSDSNSPLRERAGLLQGLSSHSDPHLTNIGNSQTRESVTDASGSSLESSKKFEPSVRQSPLEEDTIQHPGKASHKDSSPSFVDMQSNHGSRRESDAGNLWRGWGASLADVQSNPRQTSERGSKDSSGVQHIDQGPTVQINVQPTPVNVSSTVTRNVEDGATYTKGNNDVISGVHLVQTGPPELKEDLSDSTFGLQSSRPQQPDSQQSKDVSVASHYHQDSGDNPDNTMRFSPASIAVNPEPSSTSQIFERQEKLSSMDLLRRNSSQDDFENTDDREIQLSSDLLNRISDSSPPPKQSLIQPIKDEEHLNNDGTPTISSDSSSPVSPHPVIKPNSKSSSSGLQSRITDREGNNILSTPMSVFKPANGSKNKSLQDRLGLGLHLSEGNIQDQPRKTIVPQRMETSIEQHYSTLPGNSDKSRDLLHRLDLASSENEPSRPNQPLPGRGRDRGYGRGGTRAPSQSRWSEYPKKPLQHRFS